MNLILPKYSCKFIFLTLLDYTESGVYTAQLHIKIYNNLGSDVVVSMLVIMQIYIHFLALRKL